MLWKISDIIKKISSDDLTNIDGCFSVNLYAKVNTEDNVPMAEWEDSVALMQTSLQKIIDNQFQLKQTFKQMITKQQRNNLQFPEESVTCF